MMAKFTRIHFTWALKNAKKGSIKSLQSFCLSSEGLEEWRPWSLIYSLNKPGGKEHKPLVNPSGKYICKLFWCGKWRKIVVDDSIPCDEDGSPLLIVSDNPNEIWPLIISKETLKKDSFLRLVSF